MKMKQNTYTDVRYKNSLHESNYRDVYIINVYLYPR